MAKERLTIAQQLDKRKYKTPSGITWFFYALLARSPFFGPKYHVTYKVIDDINKYKGPAFIIWNHQSRRDYLFLKNLIAPHKFNMLAGYQEFFRKKFVWLFKVAQVIPKKNFTNDPKSIRAMDSIIKSGGTIGWLWPNIEDVPSGAKATVPPLLMMRSIALILFGSLVKFFFGITCACLNNQTNFFLKNS